MVYLSEIPEKLRNGLVNQDMREFETTPWADGPPDHVWYNRKTISLSMMKDQHVILREPKSLTRKTFLQSIEDKGISSPSVVMELDNQVATREAVAAGIGVAPELANLERQRDGIHRIRFVDSQVVRKKYIACKKDRSTLRKIVEFITIAENTKS